MEQFFRGGRGLSSSLEPREAFPFSLMKKETKNQGVECSPKFRTSRLNFKTGTKCSSAKLNSPDKSGSNNLRFDTPPDSKFLTAVHPKAVSVGLLPTALIIIFCVLFGSALAQSRIQFGAADQGFRRPYDFSLYRSVTVKPIQSANLKAREQARYPKVDYTQFPQELFNVDPAMLPKIQIGERLPDSVLDMPLRVVNDTYARDTITLRSCMDRPWIILDLWTEWCGPCIGSMNKWEALAKQENSNFTLLGLYASFEAHRAMPEARRKRYLSTQVIGPATSILAHLFFHGNYSLGPSIWIKDGRFFGISQAGMLKEEDYHLLLDGNLDAIPDYAQWKPITH